jgi:hypothetical protein
VIGRHHLLGGENRIDERDVKRAERRNVLRRGEQPARPGERLESGALGIALALIAMPAADRQQELEARLVGKLCGLDVIIPGGVPPFRRLGQASFRITQA